METRETLQQMSVSELRQWFDGHAKLLDKKAPTPTYTFKLKGITCSLTAKNSELIFQKFLAYVFEDEKPTFKANLVIGIRKLRSTYDQYVFEVLGDRLNEIERARPAKFRTLMTLPNVADYHKLKKAHFTQTFESLVSGAYSEIGELAEQMREWYDNMPEPFQQGDRGSAVEEAADNLERVDTPDIPEHLKTLKVVHYPMLNLTSRAKIASEISSQLNSAKDAIDEHLVEQNTLIGDYEAQNLAGELEEAAQDVDSVEFPTMYG